jgi:hypothetical protein
LPGPDFRNSGDPAGWVGPEDDDIDQTSRLRIWADTPGPPSEVIPLTDDEYQQMIAAAAWIPETLEVQQ